MEVVVCEGSAAESRSRGGRSILSSVRPESAPAAASRGVPPTRTSAPSTVPSSSAGVAR